MRTSIAGAAFCLVGAGAATVAALDTTGNNVSLNGADTLYDVTRSVLDACPGATTNTVYFKGGSSGLGAFRMVNNAQQIAPMSRALKFSEYCQIPAVQTQLGSGDLYKSAHVAASLLLALDGVSVLANTTNSCSPLASPPAAAADLVNGFGATVPMNVTDTGLPTGTPTTCPGCVGTQYTFADAFDALRLLYFGLHHDAFTNTYDCASPARRTLIRQWNNVFSTTCAAGNATCAAGITHAWRPGDLSGTTDILVSLLLGDFATKGSAEVGIGTLPGVQPQALKMNPFCNSADANSPPGSPSVSFGGSGDFADLDPIRTKCTATGSQIEDVCGSAATQFNGDLGVVLPILLPDQASALLSDNYPPNQCSGSCTFVAPIKSNQIPSGFKCPGGNPPAVGLCFMPYIVNGGDQDPRCFSINTNKCADTTGRLDGRAYNMVIVVPNVSVPPAQRASTPFQFGLDARNRIMNGSFFRIHRRHTGKSNVPNGAVGTTGLCTENDATSQIGCLADSDPCSIGYAGRSAARYFPGLGLPAVPQPDNYKALAINGIAPFTPASINANLNYAVEALFTGNSPRYPLARRLYASTNYGFGNLLGGESALAGCFENNTIVTNAISGQAVRVPATATHPGGVKCLDYPENGASTTTPLANTPGEGNQALPGCASGLSNVDACAGVTITP